MTPIRVCGNLKKEFASIDFSDASDKARHDRVAELVESLLAMHREIAEARIGGAGWIAPYNFERSCKVYPPDRFLLTSE